MCAGSSSWWSALLYAGRSDARGQGDGGALGMANLLPCLSVRDLGGPPALDLRLPPGGTKPRCGSPWHSQFDQYLDQAFGLETATEPD